MDDDRKMCVQMDDQVTGQQIASGFKSQYFRSGSSSSRHGCQPDLWCCESTLVSWWSRQDSVLRPSLEREFQELNDRVEPN